MHAPTTASPIASIVWRRLDQPGHDVARLLRMPSGWRVEGTAVYLGGDGPARLDYAVDIAEDWTTTAGTVRGFIGARDVDVAIARDGAGWTLDGVAQPEVAATRDLDLGFTPATNLLQLRRLDLRIGQRAECPVAWLAAGATTLALLPQTYHRLSATDHAYEAPTVPYRATLVVGEDGFARRYPGGWVAE